MADIAANARATRIAFDAMSKKIIEMSTVTIPAMSSAFASWGNTFSNAFDLQPDPPSKPCTFCGEKNFHAKNHKDRAFALYNFCSNCNAKWIINRWKICSEMNNSLVGRTIIVNRAYDNKPSTPRALFLRALHHFGMINIVYLVEDDGEVRVARKDKNCNVANLYGNKLLNSDGTVSQMDGTESYIVAWVPA